MSRTASRPRTPLPFLLATALFVAAPPRAGQALPLGSMWGDSPEPDDASTPTRPTPAEEARRLYDESIRNEEEARIARALGVYYAPSSGLERARVRCAPHCGVTRVFLGSPPNVQALRSGLRAQNALFVGTHPERGLGSAPRVADGITWYPRSVHRRFPCDCAVGVEANGTPWIAFESLDGAESLPDEPKYTRGEAQEAALRQLVVTDPRPDGEPPEPVVVVSAGNRAHLVHRFFLRLDRVPSTVDVDDTTLEVVKIRRFRDVPMTSAQLRHDTR